MPKIKQIFQMIKLFSNEFLGDNYFWPFNLHCKKQNFCQTTVMIRINQNWSKFVTPVLNQINFNNFKTFSHVFQCLKWKKEQNLFVYFDHEFKIEGERRNKRRQTSEIEFAEQRRGFQIKKSRWKLFHGTFSTRVIFIKT